MQTQRPKRGWMRLYRTYISIAMVASAVTLSVATTTARADLGPPRQIVRQTLDDAKKAAGDAKQAPVKEAEDAKQHAKTAVDDALDGGLATDGGADGGKPDAGDAGDTGDDLPATDAERDSDATRADRRARSIEELGRSLQKLGAHKPADDALRTELKLHARRLAWLDRIGTFAVAEHDAESSNLVKRLLEEESRRDTRWLQAWASGAGQ